MRLQQFDILKLFAIYLVILGHCFQHLLSSDYVDEPGYIMIYSFHMPLFMMISGYFAVSGLKRDLMSGIVTKARQLLLPCFTAALLFTTVTTLIYQASFLDNLDFQLKSGFWFLKTAFFCFLLARISYCFGKYRIIAFAATLALTQIPHIYRIDYSTTNIDIMYPCFVTGIVIREYWDIIEKNYKAIAIATGCIFSAMLLFWSKEFWQPTGEMMHKLKCGEFSEALYLAYLRYYRLIIGIMGSTFFISLFHWCINGARNKLIDTISKYGQYTLGIYILQTFILESLMARYINFDNVNSFIFGFIIAPLLSLLLLVICIFLSKILDSHKITAFLFLGKRIK